MVKNYKKYITVVVIVVSLLAALLAGMVVAKYVMETKREPLFTAKSFYLESDLLSSETNPQYTLQAGVDTIEFNLMNYPDDLRVSEVDIRCTATLTRTTADGDSVLLTQEVVLEKNEKTMKPVKFDDLKPGDYTVKVTSSPYSLTLQGRFTVVGLDTEVAFSVSDNAQSPRLLVTVTTTDYAGDIIIEWPEGVLPDNNDPLLALATGTSHTVRMEKNSEYIFQFFKTNPNQVYTNAIKVRKVTTE